MFKQLRAQAVKGVAVGKPTLPGSNSIAWGSLQKQTTRPMTGRVLRFQELPAGYSFKTRNTCSSGSLGIPGCSVWEWDGHENQLWRGRESEKFKQLGAQAVKGMRVSGPILKQVPLLEDHSRSRAPSPWLRECSGSRSCLMATGVYYKAGSQTGLRESWDCLSHCLDRR
jgi:hypothetical protein